MLISSDVCIPHCLRANGLLVYFLLCDLAAVEIYSQGFVRSSPDLF
jgi:hypothetical protein